jgi:FtsP/CotA-like multicopper oxidase with cupredoxin domain
MKHQRSVCILLAAIAVIIATTSDSSAKGITRQYYIAAEEVTWDFAPTGEDLIHGGNIPIPWAGSTVWKKARFIEYTDGTFSTPKAQPPWLGVLGPIIRAEVGDTVIVHFFNRTSQPYGMHPHGLRYNKDNEGAHYHPAGAGSAIPPGGSFTYTWLADEQSGPGPADPSSIVWWYHAHVNEPADTNAGLLGPIVVTKHGKARSDARPMDVDQEFVTAFMIFNEDNGNERGLMHSINGLIFGNLQGLVMRNGQRVRWYVLGMGNEVDLHSPHWHGRTVRSAGRATDVVELLPGSMVAVDMLADNPGTWLYHCHVADHIDAGMQTTFTITE